jgi:hypothetical protein
LLCVCSLNGEHDDYVSAVRGAARERLALFGVDGALELGFAHPGATLDASFAGLVAQLLVGAALFFIYQVGRLRSKDP